LPLALQQAIAAASEKAQVWPNNSQPRQVLVRLAADVAQAMLVDAGVFAAPSGDLPPMPASSVPEVDTAMQVLREVDTA
jgi:hypothetical protein